VATSSNSRVPTPVPLPHRQHREERAPGNGFLQILDQHRLVDLLTAEVALHQGFVLGLLDDSFDQGAARFLDPIGVRLIGGPRCPLAVGVLVLGLRQQYEYADGKRTTRAPDESDADRIEEARGTLIEGIIEESEDESLMERYLGGEEIDESVLIQDLEESHCPGLVLPGAAGVQWHRCRNPGIAGGCHPRIPVPDWNTHYPRCLPRRAPRTPHWPATWTRRCLPKWSRRRRTPTSAGSAWSGSSPGPSGPTRRCTCRATSRRSSAGPTGMGLRTPIMTKTSASASCRSRSASSSSAPRQRSSRATSARSAS